MGCTSPGHRTSDEVRLSPGGSVGTHQLKPSVALTSNPVVNRRSSLHSSREIGSAARSRVSLVLGEVIGHRSMTCPRKLSTSHQKYAVFSQIICLLCMV